VTSGFAAVCAILLPEADLGKPFPDLSRLSRC
jgi:hypothetical protein